MPERKLAGKVALVTGAASGIGNAIARGFVTEGAQVVVADIAEDRAAEAATDIGSAAHPVRCDVGNSTDVARAVATAVEVFDGLDILVNNAAGERAKSFVNLDDEHWQRALEVNLSGVFYGIKHAAPQITARGGGAVLNISSIAAQRVVPGLAAYSAAKAGVEALTRSAAVELRPANIRVNAIAPGLIRTEAAEKTVPVLERGLGIDIDTYLEQRQGRWGYPEEVALAALHLVGDESPFTSGLIYVIDNANTAV